MREAESFPLEVFGLDQGQTGADWHSMMTNEMNFFFHFIA